MDPRFEERAARMERARQRDARIGCGIVAVTALTGFGLLALVVWAVIRIVLHFT